MSARRAYLPRALTLAITLALAIVAAGVNAEVAQATIDDILVPGETPYTSATTGTYSGGQYSALAERLGYKLDSQVVAKGALSEAQWVYMQNRASTAAAKGGLLPFLRSGAVLKFASGAGTAIAVGSIVWKIHTDGWEGATEYDTYVEFEIERIGGGSIVQPGDPYTGGGGDFRYITTNDTAGPFGWEFTTAYNGAGTPDGWVFQYAVELAWGNSAESCSSGCYPQWGQKIVPFIQSGPPNLDNCLAQMTTCYGAALTGTKAGLQFAMAQSSNLTMYALEDDLVPLKVQLDTDTTTAGHVRAGASCTASGAGPFHAAPCLIAHIPEHTVEIFMPRTQTEEAPATAPVVELEHTAPDLDTSAEWEPITDELADECGQAIFNHIAAPSVYPYFGCDASAQDPDQGETEVLPEPEPFTLPPPAPNETAEAYRDRLEALGALGTITLTEMDAPGLEGYGPLAPTRVSLPDRSPVPVYNPLGWPSPGPAVSVTEDIDILFNPDTAIVVPTEPPGDVSVPGVDFGPITGIDWGCKFPVGFICYAVDVTDWFNVAPDAPVFTFALDGFDTPIGEVSLGVYEVDLDVMDAYMEIIRSLITVALWIGTVYGTARWLLGWGGAGDPGEAADEALDW